MSSDAVFDPVRPPYSGGLGSTCLAFGLIALLKRTNAETACWRLWDAAYWELGRSCSSYNTEQSSATKGELSRKIIPQQHASQTAATAHLLPSLTDPLHFPIHARSSHTIIPSTDG